MQPVSGTDIWYSIVASSHGYVALVRTLVDTYRKQVQLLVSTKYLGYGVDAPSQKNSFIRVTS